MIGLIPAEIPPERVRFVGNAALSGAILCGSSDVHWANACQIFRQTDCLNLAEDPRFTDVFTEALIFPEIVKPSSR